MFGVGNDSDDPISTYYADNRNPNNTGDWFNFMSEINKYGASEKPNKKFTSVTCKYCRNGQIRGGPHQSERLMNILETFFNTLEFWRFSKRSIRLLTARTP